MAIIGSVNVPVTPGADPVDVLGGFPPGVYRCTIQVPGNSPVFGGPDMTPGDGYQPLPTPSGGSREFVAVTTPGELFVSASANVVPTSCSVFAVPYVGQD